MKKKYPRSSPDIHGERKAREANRNQTTLDSPSFRKACQMVGIEPTRRQASKFLKGRGLAKSIS